MERKSHLATLRGGREVTDAGVGKVNPARKDDKRMKALSVEGRVMERVSKPVHSSHPSSVSRTNSQETVEARKQVDRDSSSTSRRSEYTKLHTRVPASNQPKNTNRNGGVSATSSKNPTDGLTKAPSRGLGSTGSREQAEWRVEGMKMAAQGLGSTRSRERAEWRVEGMKMAAQDTHSYRPQKRGSPAHSLEKHRT
jgi:hypothetical protein